jgi:anoctamin-10
MLGHFSPIYAIVNGLWCIIFTEWWKHQEVDLAIRWGVKGVSKLEGKRREFQAEKVISDPITGEKVGFFPATTRLQRQLLQIPFALIAAALLGCLIATCFGIEVFISEVYDGPLKSVLVRKTIILLVLRTNNSRYSYQQALQQLSCRS